MSDLSVKSDSSVCTEEQEMGLPLLSVALADSVACDWQHSANIRHS